MIFSKYPFSCGNSNADIFDLEQSSVGIDGESLNDIFFNVRNLTVNISVESFGDPLEAFLEAGGADGGAIGALSGLGAANAALGGSASGAGVTTRQIKASGGLNSDGSALPASKAPTTCGEYPVHTFSSGGVSFIMDLGFIYSAAGIYYPKISIQLSNGVTNTAGSYIGSVIFDRFGAVPLLSDGSISVLSIAAFGSITINERYDSLQMSPIGGNAGTVVTLSPINAEQFSGFKDVTSVFINDVPITNFSIGGTPTQQTIQVTIPQGARSGFITFLTSGKDKFLSPIEFRII